MSTGVVWLSSSSAQIALARDMLKALVPVGVIDELGFLLLHGPFADYFYPAVTTPMTRARYLLFVPAMYRHLEVSRTPRLRNVEKTVGDLQFDLLSVLTANDERAIGIQAQRNLLRPPSSIYWHALITLGCAKRKLSEASYQQMLVEGRFGNRTVRDDDGVTHDDEPESMWDPALPLSHLMPEGKFASSTTFHLRPNEAAYLRTAYSRLRYKDAPNLVTHGIDLHMDRPGTAVEQIENLWDLPGLPSEVSRIAQHARCLSLFARGTTLQYQRMLIEKKKLEDAGTDVAFREWWDKSAQDLHYWDVDAFIDEVVRLGGTVRPNDRGFLTGWMAQSRSAPSAAALLDATSARQLIKVREHSVRLAKRRLDGGHYLKIWEPSTPRPAQLYYFSYRHRVGRQIAHDIASGLRRNSP